MIPRLSRLRPSVLVMCSLGAVACYPRIYAVPEPAKVPTPDFKAISEHMLAARALAAAYEDTLAAAGRPGQGRGTKRAQRAARRARNRKASRR